MRRLFERLIKRCSVTKHKKLVEDPSNGSDPILEGVTFYVKYLGSCIVDKASGEETTSEAVKTIVTMAKKLDRKLHRVALTISLRGIKMVDCVTSDLHLDFSIYRISYCSADATYDHVFTFIATNRNDTMECHAYLCPKRKMAQSATLTIAQAFNLAFEYWQSAKERRKRKERKMESRRGDECSCDRRGKRDNKVIHARENSCEKVPKSSADVEGCTPKNIEEKMPDTSPSSGYNSSMTDSQEADGEDLKAVEDGEMLLIDLSSPKEEKTSTWNDVSIVDTDNQKWEVFEEDQDEKMDLSFTELAQRNSPLPILRRLPPNAASLQFGSFICTDSLSSSPAASPLHGSGLTNSHLCTPVGSPASRNILTPIQIRRHRSRQKSPLVTQRSVPIQSFPQAKVSNSHDHYH